MRQELPRDVGAHAVAHSNSLGAARSSVLTVWGVASAASELGGLVFICFYHKTTWKTMVVFGDRYHQISIRGGLISIYTWWVFEVYVQLPGNGMEMVYRPRQKPCRDPAPLRVQGPAALSASQPPRRHPADTQPIAPLPPQKKKDRKDVDQSFIMIY